VVKAAAAALGNASPGAAAASAAAVASPGDLVLLQGLLLQLWSPLQFLGWFYR
jgi:ABC-type transport system involved in Fe-S cluster assembly fused permease/ATPase subunit